MTIDNQDRMNQALKNATLHHSNLFMNITTSNSISPPPPSTADKPTTPAEAIKHIKKEVQKNLIADWNAIHRLESTARIMHEHCIGHTATPRLTGGANVKGKDTFADWKYTNVSDAESATLQINFHIDNQDPSTSITKEFPLANSIEDIGKAVQASLETKVIYPVHAKAVFAAVATYHKMKIAELIAEEYNLQREDDLLERKPNVQHSEDTIGTLHGMSDTTKRLAQHQTTAAKAIEFELLTHDIEETKKLAEKIGEQLPKTGVAK